MNGGSHHHNSKTVGVWYEWAPLDGELQERYLRRLGLSLEAPSVDALQRLHRRHVERVPYETMWIHSGEIWGINPVDLCGSQSRVEADTAITSTAHSVRSCVRWDTRSLTMWGAYTVLKVRTLLRCEIISYSR